MVWVWLASQHNHNIKWEFKKGFDYLDNFVNCISKSWWLERDYGRKEELSMYCAQNVLSLGTVPVSKQHLFTLSLSVFIVKSSHCRDTKKKKKSLNWYSKWQEGKSRGVRVLCMLLGGIWINASAYLSRGEPCLVTGGGNGPPLSWGPPVHLGSDVGRLGRELLPALAVTEGCGDREDWRIPLRASEEKW